jgi:photosystem II stability/assembly factor-like uncharacterized protein
VADGFRIYVLRFNFSIASASMKKILLLAFALYFVQTASAQWTTQPLTLTEWRPQTNSVFGNFVTVKVINANVVWAFGGTGSPPSSPTKVSRTTDGGLTWLDATGDLPTTFGPGAFDATSDQAAYVGSDDGQIFATTNGGTNWTLQSTNTNSFIDGIVFVTSSLGYAVGDPADTAWVLLKTTNAGLNWNSLPMLVASGGESGYTNSFAWTDANNGWFGTDNSRIYHTTNGGQSWLFATTPSADVFALTFSSASNGIAGFQTWPYTATTIDGGLTWISTADSSVGGTVFGLSALANTSVAYLNTSSNIYRTTNGGINWAIQSSIPIVGAGDVNVLNVTTGWYVGEVSQVLKFFNLPTPDFNTVRVASGTAAWAAGNNGLYARTTNGGTKWQVRLIPTVANVQLTAISGVDSIGATAYLLGTSGSTSTIYETTDGGNNWITQLQTATPLSGFGFWDALDGLAIGPPSNGNFVIYKTQDGGVTWMSVSANIPSPLGDESILSASDVLTVVAGTSTAWFGTTSSTPRVFNTTDGGYTWTANTTPFAGGGGTGISGLSFQDLLNGYAVANTDTANIASSTDGGITWTQIAGALPVGAKGDVKGTSGGRVAVAGVNGLGYLQSGSATWTGFGSTPYTGVDFFNSSIGWAVGKGGLIAIENPAFVSTPHDKPRTSQHFALLQNYPNPFNPATTICYTLATASKVNLKVYDVLGREVASLVNETQSAGAYHVQFDAGHLASGLYFYRLQAGSFVETKKMLLVK